MLRFPVAWERRLPRRIPHQQRLMFTQEGNHFTCRAARRRRDRTRMLPLAIDPQLVRSFAGNAQDERLALSAVRFHLNQEVLIRDPASKGAIVQALPRSNSFVRSVSIRAGGRSDIRRARVERFRTRRGYGASTVGSPSRYPNPAKKMSASRSVVAYSLLRPRP